MPLRLAAVCATALAVCLAVACNGDGKSDAEDAPSKLSKAGFKKAAEVLPEKEKEPVDETLPPERLWSPKELGFAKKGKASKTCFPRTEKDYAMVVGRAGDLVVRVEDFTATFHTFTLDSTKNGKDTLETRKKLVHQLLDQELLALSARRKGYESTQVGNLLQKRELADMIRKDMREQARSEISEEAYKKYYKSHPEKYMIHPDQRRVVQIIVKPKKAAAKLIKQYVQEKIAVKDFSKAARSFSLDPKAKETSGRTDWFDREGMGAKGHVIPIPHAQAAFKIKKKGDLYKSPLPSSKGFHILMLLSTREEKWTPYKKVKYSIMKKFVSERQKVLVEKLLENMKRNHPVSVYLNLLEKISPVPCL
jgi:peptidyl-prolyl cis-trans isomerase C